MSNYWRNAGFTFNKYTAVAARVMRQALKEEKRVTFAREDYTEARAAVWSKGVQAEPEPLLKSATKQN
uniref:ARAD1C13277p n=1 Tax=Blastobotrys adeninivorans TaxID=409370 RepID=A0A060T0H1_BLAAD